MSATARRVHEGIVLLEDAFGLKRFLESDRTAPGRWVKAVLSLDSAGRLSVYAPHESDFASQRGYPTGSPMARPLLLRFRLDSESEVHSSDDPALSNCICLVALAQGEGVADCEALRFRTSRFTSELKWLKKIGGVLDDLPTFWYIKDDRGNVLGPHGLQEMRGWIADGLIVIGDSVRTEDRLGRAGEWCAIEETALMLGWEEGQSALTAADVTQWAVGSPGGRGRADTAGTGTPTFASRLNPMGNPISNSPRLGRKGTKGKKKKAPPGDAEVLKKYGAFGLLRRELTKQLGRKLRSRKKRRDASDAAGSAASPSSGAEVEFSFTMTNVKKVVLDDPCLRAAAEAALLAEVDAAVAASEAMEASGDEDDDFSAVHALSDRAAALSARHAQLSRRLSQVVERRLSQMPTSASTSTGGNAEESLADQLVAAGFGEISMLADDNGEGDAEEGGEDEVPPGEEAAERAIAALAAERLAAKAARRKKNGGRKKKRTVFVSERPPSWQRREGAITKKKKKRIPTAVVDSKARWQMERISATDTSTSDDAHRRASVQRLDFLREQSAMLSPKHIEKRRQSIAVAHRSISLGRRASHVAEKAAVTRDLRNRAKSVDEEDEAAAADAADELQSENGLLPSGWAAESDGSGGTYYYDKTSRRATWTMPPTQVRSRVGTLQSFDEGDEEEAEAAAAAAAEMEVVESCPPAETLSAFGALAVDSFLTSTAAVGVQQRRAADIFTQRWDHTSEAAYYESARTRRMSWTSPVERGALPSEIWRECWDDNSDAAYFLNEVCTFQTRLVYRVPLSRAPLHPARGFSRFLHTPLPHPNVTLPSLAGDGRNSVGCPQPRRRRGR